MTRTLRGGPAAVGIAAAAPTPVQEAPTAARCPGLVHRVGWADCGACGRPLAVRQFWTRGESCPVTFTTHATGRSGELTMRDLAHWAESITPGFIGPTLP